MTRKTITGLTFAILLSVPSLSSASPMSSSRVLPRSVSGLWEQAWQGFKSHLEVALGLSVVKQPSGNIPQPTTDPDDDMGTIVGISKGSG
jgi:hypothetical protein